jgi:hypothetical protein
MRALKVDFRGRSEGPVGGNTEVDWIAVKQLVSASMIEENEHQISDFGTTAFRQGETRSLLELLNNWTLSGHRHVGNSGRDSEWMVGHSEVVLLIAEEQAVCSGRLK